MSENEKVEFTPFKNIGLCFSGGGYRATFFSLGTLTYLNQVQYKGKPLLESVKAISTVSGGTLTGVGYAKAVQDANFDFETFFKSFYYSFTPENDKLLETAINKLENASVWEKTSKKRSLINSFALTYAEMPIFKGSFENFKADNIRQLEHVCFNSTDFSFGMIYRFQNTGYFGNNPLYIKNSSEIDALRYEIQLGDAIASSSCFPLGFEPLVFPDDYFKDHNSVAYKNLKGLDDFIDGVGIMDGGIADNQGIGSMILISRRMESQLDLIMVNDVGSYKMEPWKPDTTKIGKSSSLNNIIHKLLEYFTIKPLYWITLLLGVILLIGNSFFEMNGNHWTGLYIVGGVVLGIGVLLTTFGIVASIIKSVVTSKAKNMFKENVPESLLDDILSFKKLPIDLIQRMLAERMTSASKMINDVFLKQLRRLNYKLFYSKESLKNRRLTATVYKLNGQKTAFSSGTYSKEIKPQPSTSLKSVALTASETPTTLWWSEEDIAKNRMDTLIACGGFTACYELMDYILKLKKSEPAVLKDFTEIDALYASLEKDWKAFNKNPLWLVEKLK
jgi:hypothetical protein